MRAYWRLGFPGWRIAAICGMDIKIKVDVRRDEEAGVYYATSDDIGLGVESESLDGLMKEIHAAIPVLLEVSHFPIDKPRADIRLHGNFAVA